MENKINEQIVNKLNLLGLTISTCESMTGGALCSNLVLANNASKCFLGSITPYATNFKTKLAKVKGETIDTYGLYSKQVANEMAKGCQKVFNSDICISVTGTAAGNNPGAFVTIIVFDKMYDYQFVSRFNDRVSTINQCVAFCYNQLWDLIKDLKK